MNKKRPPIPLLIVAGLVVVIAGYFLIDAFFGNNQEDLLTSGTIEAVTITISPELAGRVAEVYVGEGDEVEAGENLFRLDDSIYLAQREVAVATMNLAKAGLESAQAQYSLALNAARMEISAQRAYYWQLQAYGSYSLPGWYFSQVEIIDAAQEQVTNEKTKLENAVDALTALQDDPAYADFMEAEVRMIQAQSAYAVAQDVLSHAYAVAGGEDAREAAEVEFEQAKNELEAAITAYDNLAESEEASQFFDARLSLALAQEGYESAQDRLLLVQTGAYAPQLVAADAAVNQAEYAFKQAEASLSLLDAQIEKLMVKSPSPGVILTRTIQPGEVLAPGALAMKLACLDEITITVFVPEDMYGTIELGQMAVVVVDSFPDIQFEAEVMVIADQAEFTPRNVQTVEGRKTTVFAIQLKVDDPNRRLKPGMPADVYFTEDDEE